MSLGADLFEVFLLDDSCMSSAMFSPRGGLPAVGSVEQGNRGHGATGLEAT